MYTLLKPIQVREILLRREVKIFTPDIFTRLFQLSPYKTKYFLESQVKAGFLLRLKQGMYALKTDPPVEEEVANALYKPSYISFEYALAYYNIIPEMTYAITSATTKATRTFVFQERAFSYRSIKEEAFTGYSLVKKDTKSILIAEPEKALVDYFYFVTLRKITENDRLIIHTSKNENMKMDELNKEKIFQYAQLYDNNGKNRVASLLKEVI